MEYGQTLRMLEPKRTIWDPRSAMAEEVIEVMGGQTEEAPAEPRRVVILACGHWDHFDRLHHNSVSQPMAWCFRHRQDERVLKVAEL